MRRILSVILILSTVFTLSACGNNGATSSTNNKNTNVNKNTNLWQQEEFYISTLWPYEYAVTSDEAKKRSIDLCKEAGLNLVEITFDCSETILNHCDEIGINVLAGSKFKYGGPHGYDVLWNETLIKNEVNKIKNHKSVIGYIVCDEILAGEMEEAKQICDYVSKYDLDRLPYVCLHPPGDSAGGGWSNTINPEKSDYAKYIQDCLDTVNPPVLSFDQYPFNNPEKTDFTYDDWFKSMGYYRKKANEYKIPFWTFIRSIDGDGKNTLLKSQIEVQMNTALAYGAKYISYFTTGGYLYTMDTIEKTSSFEEGKEITANTMKIGSFLFDKVGTAIYHTGLNKQDFYNRIFFLDNISESDLIEEAPDNLIISVFEDEDSEYMMIVNKNLKKEVKGNIKLKSKKKVSEFNISTGEFGDSASKKTISYTIEAGGAAVYKVK